MNDYQRADRPWTCPHCQIQVHRAGYQAHVRRCADATPAARAYYREHRTWPGPNTPPVRQARPALLLAYRHEPRTAKG